MNLDGIAGRQLLGRLSAGMRERKRAAQNDNFEQPLGARGAKQAATPNGKETADHASLAKSP
jgi:hypothetical protein